MLPPELLLHIFQFTSNNTLYIASRVNKLFLSQFSNDYLWQAKSKNEFAIVQLEGSYNSWQQYYQQVAFYFFDPKNHGDYLILSNNNRTVQNNASHTDWNTVVCTRKLKRGQVYRWQFRIVRFVSQSGTTNFICGIAEPTAKYEGKDKIVVGYAKDKGYSYTFMFNMSMHESYSGSGIPNTPKVDFADNDVLGVEFDYTTALGKLSYYYNGTLFGTAFDNITGHDYYVPAFAMSGDQQIAQVEPFGYNIVNGKKVQGL